MIIGIMISSSFLISTQSNQKFSVFDQHINIPQSSDTTPFYLCDGSFTYDEDTYLKKYSDTDTFYVMDFNTKKRNKVTNIDEKLVEFEIEYTYTPYDAYIYDGTYKYYPDEYNIAFFDAGGYFITSQASLYFTLKYQLDKESGFIQDIKVPHDAYYIGLIAFYDDGEYWTMVYFSPGSIYEDTWFFQPESKEWNIGDNPFGNYEVKEFDKFQDYITVVLESDKPDGYDDLQYKNRITYERNSGLELTYDYEWIENNVKIFTDYERFDGDLFSLIDDGNPTIVAPKGITVKKGNTVILTFEVEEKNFDHYKLYKNGIPFDAVYEKQPNWSFEITPTEGNSTWTLEIVDELGNSSKATTWINYEPSLLPGLGFIVLSISLLSLASLLKLSRRR